MDVGSDTFPRDEVTGLAAFDHLDQVSTVSTLSMVEEAPAPVPRILTPPPPPAGYARGSFVPQQARTGMTLPPPPPGTAAAARTFSRPPQPSAAGSVAPGAAPVRADATEIVDVDAMASSWEDPDDAATRVQAGSPAAELHMDWDDDEPPTQMRGESGQVTSHDTGLAMDWEGDDIDTRLREVEGDGGADTLAYQPAGDSGRPSPFPSARASAAGNVAAATYTDVVRGAPSPFAAEDIANETAWGQDLRTDRRSQLWIAAAALGIILLAFGIRAMFAKEASAIVTLATVPSDAQVMIDGKPVSGTSSPFSANDLTPGVAHQLVVRKDGFAEQRTSFTVTAGEAKTLPTVELAASAGNSGFAIDSIPAGAQVRIDGNAIGMTTPARVTSVTPGLHKLELVHEGYTTYEMQVFVPDTQVLELPTVTMGAAIAGAAPKKAEAPAQTAVATAAPAPHKAASNAARERRHERRAAARAGHGGAAVATVRAPKSQKLKPVKAVAAAPQAGKGVLRVNSRPWAQVFVDGRMVGNTPQMALQLAAGKHTIKLANPQMGLSKSFAISVKPGETQTKVMNLID